MSGIPFTLAQSFILLTLATHMWTPSDFLGCPIITSTNAVSTTTTMGPVTSDFFLLSTNQTHNILAIIKSMTIQVGNALVSGGIIPDWVQIL